MACGLNHQTRVKLEPSKLDPVAYFLLSALVRKKEEIKIVKILITKSGSHMMEFQMTVNCAPNTEIS